MVKVTPRGVFSAETGLPGPWHRYIGDAKINKSLTGFKDCGKIRMNVPTWASGAFGHGDVLRHGDEYWLYFQGTSDGGKTFQIGLARQPVNTAPEK